MESKSKITSITYDERGNCLVTILLPIRFKEQLKVLAKTDVSVIIKKFAKKRSTNANKYFWEICTQIANAVGITKEEVYRDCIKHCGVFEDCEMTKEAGEGMSKMWSAIGTGWFTEQVDYAEDGDSLLIRRFYGSSTYDTKQMSRIIDYAINEAKNIGIETDTPDEINRIKSLWKGSGINA